MEAEYRVSVVLAGSSSPMKLQGVREGDQK